MRNDNTFTGEVEIMRHHKIVVPGMTVVPELVSGQQQGGVAMGIGHALMEEFPLYADGPGDGTWNFNRYTRSEERRVGKEWRWRLGRDEERKKKGKRERSRHVGGEKE